MPSLAISKYGAGVGYNRSGTNTADGNISFMATAYTLDANGLLVFDATHLLRYSPNAAYQLGSPRNRWGDYSSVTLDPTNSRYFWAVGEYASFGPGTGNGDGTSDRWATFISQVQLGVPEPATWALMIGGFGFVGSSMRRRRALDTVAA